MTINEKKKKLKHAWVNLNKRKQDKDHRLAFYNHSFSSFFFYIMKMRSRLNT